MIDNGPTTRPDEIKRISQNEYEFRLTVLRFIDRMDAWKDNHEKDDRNRFDAIEKKLTPITSSVNDYNETSQQVAGARKLLIGIAAIGASCWAVFEAIIYLIKLAKGQP